ncbi:MAG: V-type ATPase subunit [bacterium]
MVEFTYAVGRIRALEAQLLDESQIIRLVDAKDFETAFLVLRENANYAEKIDRLPDSFDLEALLENELLWTKSLLADLAPGNKFLTVLWKKYDPSLTLNEYLAILKKSLGQECPPLFTKYVRGYIILHQLRTDILNGQADLNTAQNKYKYTDYDRVISVGLEQYKKTGSLFALEREIDDHLTDAVKKARYCSFGIEPLIGFLIAKEMEIKILRLILVAKKMQVKTDKIKERLRHSYV